jgi:hypothetical protein
MSYTCLELIINFVFKEISYIKLLKCVYEILQQGVRNYPNFLAHRSSIVLKNTAPFKQI